MCYSVAQADLAIAVILLPQALKGCYGKREVFGGSVALSFWRRTQTCTFRYFVLFLVLVLVPDVGPRTLFVLSVAIEGCWFENMNQTRQPEMYMITLLVHTPVLHVYCLFITLWSLCSYSS